VYWHQEIFKCKKILLPYTHAVAGTIVPIRRTGEYTLYTRLSLLVFGIKQRGHPIVGGLFVSGII
jgi:hypothetical protein